MMNKISVIERKESSNQFFLRLKVEDKPGVLAQMDKIRGVSNVIRVHGLK